MNGRWAGCPRRNDPGHDRTTFSSHRPRLFSDRTLHRAPDRPRELGQRFLCRRNENRTFVDSLNRMRTTHAIANRPLQLDEPRSGAISVWIG